MDNYKNIDSLFQSAKEQKPLRSFDETKDQFIRSQALNNERNAPDLKRNSIIKKLIIMLVSASLIVSVILLMTNESAKPNNPTNSEMEVVESDHKKELNQSKGISVQGDPEKSEKKILAVQGARDTFLIEQLDINVVAKDTASLYPLIEFPGKNSGFKDEYIFPKLTEEEIAANHKQKRQMLKALEKLDKKSYAIIPSGSFNFKGKMVSVQSFLIQRTEVTNLEYRTFLFDLLIQGRKDEFLKAKPDQAMWTKLFGETNKQMEELYFSHAAYNEYPVVNVSREGAELYCKWLSQELNKSLDPKKRGQFNDIRLPVREEWVMAASAEGKTDPYSWEGQFTRNSDGCYLANYKPTDSTYMDDGGFYTVKVTSYNPNLHGMFNTCGNVAEMVYDDIKTRSSGTAGGGWMNNAEEIKIQGPDPYKGVADPHPNIGFRVVMTYLNK